MDKKNLTIILLAILFGASGITNVILSIEGGTIGPIEHINYVVIATSYPGLAKNDPVDTWDQVSMWHQQQVTEGLVYYDISKHPNYAPTPRLAESWVWNNQTCITFKIREGVVFHDGTPLTASAIKWNFDRLMWFSNISGLVPANDTSKTGFSSSLYYLSNGTYLFNSFVADDVNMEFTIILNVPFGPLLDLLCFISTNIISPTSHKFYEIAQLDEILVGTGPYKMLNHIPREQIRYVRNRRWWGKAQYFEQIIMLFVDDDIERMNTGLAGRYDYVSGVLKTYIDLFKNTSGMHVEDSGEDLGYQYLEFNCGPGSPDLGNPWDYQMVNSTWRRALALTLNYTYIWEEIKNDEVSSGLPAVPRSMPGYNHSLEGKMIHDYPFDGTYDGNVKKARELMQSMGFGYEGPNKTNPWNTTYPGTDDIKWKSSNFRDIRMWYSDNFPNFGYCTCFKIDELQNLLYYNFNLIGVYPSFEPVRAVPEYYLCDYMNNCEMGSNSWAPDYLNPYSMINPLFNNESYCPSRISDPILKNMIHDAINTINYTENLEKWMDIQSYIFDVTRPENPSTYCHVPLWTNKVYQVHKTNLKGVNYNVLNILDTWNWYYE